MKVLKWRFDIFCQKFDPVRTIRDFHRRRDEPELLAGIVRSDREQSITMVDRILLIVDPGSNHPKLATRLRSREKPALAGGVAPRFQQDVLAIPGLAHSEVEALVGLVKN